MSNLYLLSLLILLLNILSPLHANPTCPNACNNGQCVPGNICDCDPGYFNSIGPCDTLVAPLINDRFSPEDIAPGDWSYFYIPLAQIHDDIQLDFQVQTGSANAYILLQDSDSYNLPTETSSTPFIISPTVDDDNTVSRIIRERAIENTNGGYLTIALHNNNPSVAKVQVQYVIDNSDDSDDGGSVGSQDILKALVVVPVLAVGIMSCAGLYALAKARRRQLINQQRINLQVNPHDPNQNYHVVVVMGQDGAQMMAPNPEDHRAIQAQVTNYINAQNRRGRHGQVVPFYQQGVPQQSQKHSQLLTKEEIQKYFPKKAFSKIKSPFPQPTCSICLDEFKPESLCHELYCYHIFHEVCIEEWLAKHDSCPDCRKPITKEAIQQFFINKKKQEGHHQHHSLLNLQSPHQGQSPQNVNNVHQ